jgi:hypothetical protein
MKLSPLSMPVILQAAAKIDTEGIRTALLDLFFLLRK